MNGKPKHLPRRRYANAFLLLLCVMPGLTGRAEVAAPSTAPSTTPATSPSEQRIDLLAMGDWGEGAPAQKAVATALVDYVTEKRVPFSGMLLAGDNFYVPLKGIYDPQWQTLFESMYDPQRLDFPFFVTLGNHDYDNGKDRIELAYARAHPQSRWKFPSRWYRTDLPSAEHPMVTLIMLDSNMDLLGPVGWRDQRKWLDQELGKPRTAEWVICCAHHPMFSNGIGSIGVLRRDWEPIFEKNHVDFYLSGHEHNLQHIEVPGCSQSMVIAGGGGAHAHPMLHDDLGPFSRTLYGFVHFQLTPTRAVVSYIGTDDKPVHAFERTREGRVTVLMTTRSDTAATKPLEIIQGLFEKIHGPATQPATRSTTRPTTRPVLELAPAGAL